MPGVASRRIGMTTTILSVEGMTCGSCTAHVEAALAIPGVDHADVDLASGSVAITHAPSVSVDSLVAAIVGAGYPATALTAAPRAAPRSGCCCGPKQRHEPLTP